MSSRCAVLFAVCGALAAVPGQSSVCRGNGVGNGFAVSTPLTTGRTTTLLFGSLTAPGGFASVGLSDGIGPTNLPLPGFGPLCLDINSGALAVEHFLLDASGTALVTFAVPNDPLLATLPPIFGLAAVFDAAGVSITKTVRFQWELPDAYDALPAAAPRSLHTATPLSHHVFQNDPRVLIAGGATGSLVAPVPTATTVLFDPLTRTFANGPSLSLPRSLHGAVHLLDGRILLTGGMTTGGLVTATCDLFDPVTGTITPAASMHGPRTGHATTLLFDGRVLVSGGFSNWQNADTNFAARLGTAQGTLEVYDPVTDTWTLGPLMAIGRAGHSQTLLFDGRVLIAGGVSTGQTVLAGGTTPIQVPVFTPNCQLFDPSNGTLAPTATLTLARGFHGASLRPDGSVLVTGGAASIGSYGAAACTNSCVSWSSGGGGAWTNAASLAVGVAFHTQVDDPSSGGAIVLGGFTGEFGFAPASAQAVLHTGAVATATAPIGGSTPSGRAGHSCTPLQDGTWLVFGGQAPGATAVTTLGSSFVHVR